MEYRVDSVGALIFSPKNGKKDLSLDTLDEKIKALEKDIQALKKENKVLKNEIEEIKKGMMS